MEKKRLEWMDITKALGIFVVLVVHTGISLGPITFLGGMFYMPIFFVLAGMTFTYRPEEKFWDFAKKKAKRLLIPYFGYNAFLLLIAVVRNTVTKEAVLGIFYSRNMLYREGYGENIHFMTILNAPTWFLTCLFISLLLFFGMMKWAKGKLKNMGILCGVALIIMIFYQYLGKTLLPWSLDCAIYATGFLLMGYYIKQMNLIEFFSKKPHFLIGGFLGFVALSYLNGGVNMSLAIYGYSMGLYWMIGGLGSILCMEVALFIEKRFSRLGHILGWIGRHTIPILCLHLLAYAVIGALV